MTEPTQRVRVVRFYHVWYEATVWVPIDEDGEYSEDDVYDAADAVVFTEMERDFIESYSEAE